ncbi:MAG: helix-turn-helix transcriptional regulator [Desulfomonilia bacterium]|jgi:hypothetical protein|nr:helix-turn-helix transcriptional regulator [Desulfomonilia bacterium]
MAKPFRKLIENLPPERKERIRIKTGVLKNEMARHELRLALQLTQEELANTLNMKQTAISRFEHQYGYIHQHPQEDPFHDGSRSENHRPFL